jgi:hypothetical protein
MAQLTFTHSHYGCGILIILRLSVLHIPRHCVIASRQQMRKLLDDYRGHAAFDNNVAYVGGGSERRFRAVPRIALKNRVHALVKTFALRRKVCAFEARTRTSPG